MPLPLEIAPCVSCWTPPFNVPPPLQKFLDLPLHDTNSLSTNEAQNVDFPIHDCSACILTSAERPASQVCQRLVFKGGCYSQVSLC